MKYFLIPERIFKLSFYKKIVAVIGIFILFIGHITLIVNLTAGRYVIAVNILSWALLVYPILLVIIIIWAILSLKFHWQGKDISYENLEKRRYSMRLYGILVVTILFIVTIFLWRSYTPLYPSRYNNQTEVQFLLIFATFVSVSAIVYVEMFWNFLASPLSRLKQWINVNSTTFKLALQTAAVSIVWFVTGNDLDNALSLTRQTIEYDMIYSGLSVLLWFKVLAQGISWTAAIVSLGSVIFGYLRLPDTTFNKIKKQKDELSKPYNKENSASILASEEVFFEEGPNSLITSNSGLDKRPNEKIENLIFLLEDIIKKSQIDTRANKKQALNKSEAIVRQGARLTRERLMGEVNSLTRRGNVNLVIGSITSLIAATTLWMLVANAPQGATEITVLIGYYMPRISVAIFIEIFSFFFLRLYKNGLSEIMYYQNELTNLETKMLALEISTLLPSKDSLQQILRDFAKTDRNIVLRAGESTIELEKIKSDQQNMGTLFDTLLSTASSIKDSLKVGK